MVLAEKILAKIYSSCISSITSSALLAGYCLHAAQVKARRCPTRGVEDWMERARARMRVVLIIIVGALESCLRIPLGYINEVTDGRKH